MTTPNASKLPISLHEKLACHQLSILVPVPFDDLTQYIVDVYTDPDYDLVMNKKLDEHFQNLDNMQRKEQSFESQFYYACAWLAQYVTFERWKRKELEENGGQEPDFSDAYESGTRSAEVDAVLGLAGSVKSEGAYDGGLSEALVKFPALLIGKVKHTVIRSLEDQKDSVFRFMTTRYQKLNG